MTSPSGPPDGAGGYPGPAPTQGYPPGAHAAPTAQQPASGSLQSEVHTLERAIFEVKRIIVGQDQLVERMLVGLLAKGHVLLEGVPGVAKTLAVETFAKVVGGSFARIQFTPDLVPTDIVGTRIYRVGKEEFDIELGPVMVNFLLADEINRAPAKVQSALLEIMAERKISIGGKTFPLPSPFLVMATQNPIEQEGVYQLPEAQRDRFLFKLNVGYPSPEEEREIIYRMGVKPPEPKQILTTDDLLRLQDVAANTFVHHALVDYVVRGSVTYREGPFIWWEHLLEGGQGEPIWFSVEEDEGRLELAFWTKRPDLALQPIGPLTIDGVQYNEVETGDAQY
ncbi:MAG: DUF4178 domain-containing protein, partial [Actinobacteria bacterium]|nr:DUF4178 domain-containing protein [Actinomycetota bacterium]